MLNKKIYTQLVRGLEQHLWFLGQDTLDLKHNLLVRYGFRRYRIRGHGGSNRYKMKWRSRTVDLHSFCVGMYSTKHDGFLYVRAHDKAYAYLGKKAPLPGRYRKTFLMLPSNKESKERFFKASCEFLEWLEEYESWVDATCGKSYRRRCYRLYHRKWLSPAKARTWFKKYRKLGSGTVNLK